jgi:hypothetical protein
MQFLLFTSYIWRNVVLDCWYSVVLSRDNLERSNDLLLLNLY